MLGVADSVTKWFCTEVKCICICIMDMDMDMYMYMYMYMHMYMYVHVHVYVYVYVYMCLHLSVYIYMMSGMYLMYICIYIYVYMIFLGILQDFRSRKRYQSEIRAFRPAPSTEFQQGGTCCGSHLGWGSNIFAKLCQV